MSRKTFTLALILFAILGVAAERALAGSPSATASSIPTPAASSKLTPSQREFAAAFVKASNTKDTGAMRQLVAPEVLACFDKETSPFLDRWLERQARLTISTDYQASFSDYKGGIQTSPLLKYPAAPTNTMEVRFGMGRGSTATLIRQVRREKDKYYLVGPCLTAQGVENFRATEKKRAERIEKARAIYSKLEDPLLTQLRTLIKQNKFREAMQLCTKSLKIDNFTARDVLLILAGREPE